MSFPSDPWALLGLDRATSSERDVKRAYARLLKQHRPDQDPEGFQHVSDAYQQALKDLAAADSGISNSSPEMVPVSLSKPQSDALEEPLTAGPAPEASQGNNVPFPSAGDGMQEETNAASSTPPGPRRLEDFPDLPEKFLTAFENLKQRLQRVAHVPEVPEFNVLRNMVREDPTTLAAPWVAVLEALFSTERGLKLLPQIHAQDVLLLMLHGESSCAARILLSWRDDVSLLNRLTQLANQMLERKVADQPGMLAAIHFTAKITAFHLPHVSSRLADELYRQTGPGVREQIVKEIEIRSAAGKIFSILSHPQRRFWEHQLFESGGGETDWTSPANAAALKTVLLNCDQNWEGWPLVAQTVPREILDESLRRERLAAAQANVAAVHSGRRHSSSRWQDFVPSGRWVFVGLWLVFHLIASLARMNTGSPSASMPSTREIPASSLYDPKGHRVPAHSKSQDMQDTLDRTLDTLPGGNRGPKGIVVPTTTQTIETPGLDYQPSQSGSSVGGGGYRIGG